MTKWNRIWVLALVLAIAIAPAMARKEFQEIEGGQFLYPSDITADGSMLVLTSLFGTGAFTWTAEDGLVSIDEAAFCSGQLRMSSDGSVLVGNRQDDVNGICQPHRYDGDGIWTAMGSEPGALECGPGSGIGSSYDINNDTAVGLFWTAQLCRAIGGTWDINAAMAGPRLETTVPNRPTRGNGITDDGSVVVGWQDTQFGFRSAVKWVNGVQSPILDDNGNLVGEALGTNSDATVLWGAGWQGDVGGTGQGWLFVEGQGMIPMGVGGLGRNIQSPTLGASEDGTVAIGITRDFDNFIEGGWIYREKFGTEKFDDFLKGWGGRGWQIMIPTVISDDGSVIGGRGINPDGQLSSWIVNLKAQGNPN